MKNLLFTTSLLDLRPIFCLTMSDLCNSFQLGVAVPPGGGGTSMFSVSGMCRWNRV